MIFHVSHPVLGTGLMLTGLLVALHGLKNGCLFEPLHLYFFVHLMALGGSFLELFGYKHGFTPGFYAVLFSGYLTFLIGGVLGIRGDYNGGAVRKFRLTSLELGVLLAGISSIFLLSRIAGGWPLLSSAPGMARLSLFVHRFTPQLFEFGMFAAFVGVVALVMGRKPIYLFPVLVILGEVLLTGSRAQILHVFLFGLTLVQLSWNVNLWKIVLGGAAAFLLLFVGVGLARDPSGSHTSLGGSLALYEGAKMVYCYLCNGYWNFSYGMNRVLEGTQVYTWGVSTLSGLWFLFMDVIGLQHSYGWDVLAFNDSTQKYHGLNSATYMWAFIKDFGVAGMLLVNFAYAFLLARIYRLAQSDARYAIIYAYLSYQIMVSFNILWTTEGLSVLGFILVAAYAFFTRRGEETGKEFAKP